jgi:tol-pal system protein YbgF
MSPSRIITAAVAAAGLTACLLAGGCAPQLDRIEAGVRQNQEELTDLRDQMQQTREEVQAINNLLHVEQSSGLETSAQRAVQIGQLARRLEELAQKFDDNMEFMRSLSARVDLLTGGEGGGAPGPGGQHEPSTAEGGGPGGPVPPGGLPEEGRAIFQQAQLDRNRGNLELAKQGFSEFLQRYPDSELADDALYWLGDLEYGQKNYEQALARFQQLVEEFPGSERVPAAQLKAAYCLEELGRPEEARAQLRQLLQEHPDAPEAALARELLDSAP